MIYQYLLICTEKKINNLIKNIYKAELLEEKNNFNIFKLFTKDKQEILFLENNVEGNNDGLNFTLENYQFIETILLGTTEKNLNFDYNVGDIIFPNTFISLNTDKAIFLEPNIGENYDLNNFGVILNGSSLSIGIKKANDIELENLEGIDIINTYIYDELYILKNYNKEFNIKVIELIKSESGINDTQINNLLLMLELIISE